MRKLIATFLLLSFNSYAVPPVAVNGEQQANAYVQNIKAPNYQATSLGGIDTRIESGNTNLLVNPSFEHSTVTTGWTVTNATASANLTDMVEGKKDLSLALTAALTVTQDSTVNAANLVGLQGVASIKIKTSDVTGLKVCARNAGVTSTTLCVDVAVNGGWKHVVIPFIMTATSNGIAITSTGTTGTVKIDDAFVGTSDPFQNVANDNTYQGSISSTGVLSGTDRTFFSSCSLSVGVATCTVSSSLGLTQPPSCVITVAAPPILWVITSSSSTTVVFSAVSGTTNQPINYACKKTGSDYSQSSKIYSQSSRDYDWTAYTPTFSAGFGSVAAPNCFHQRRGHNLSVLCYPTSGVTAAAVGAISLPTGLEIDSNVIKSTNTTAAAGQIIGEYQSSTGGSNNSWIVTALGTSTSNVYVGGVLGGATPTRPVNISSILANSTLFNVKFTVPILGWSDYGTIVGSFAGVPSVPGGSGSIDTFAVNYGTTNATTVCSATPCSYLDQIGTAVSSVSFTGAGAYSLNTVRTYSKLKCILNSNTGVPTIPASQNTVTCSSCSALAFTTVITGGAATNTFGNLQCMGSY